MNIPDFTTVSSTPLIDKDGKITDMWRTVFNQLFQQLQQNASNAGLVAPNQTTVNISQFTTKNGAMFYDADIHAMKVCINGAIKTFNLT
jgi:hypothetical protein